MRSTVSKTWFILSKKYSLPYNAPQKDVVLAYSFVWLTGKGTAVPSVTAGYVAALIAMGHRVTVLDADECAAQGRNVFVEAIEKAAPAAVFGYGMLPILETDTPANFFEHKRIPYVSLFYDDPEFYAGIFTEARLRELIASPYFCATASDRIYVDVLKQHGFSRVEWLPLATDPALFAGRQEARFETAAAFVGTLSQTPQTLHDARAAKFASSPALNRCLDKIVSSPSVYRACEEYLSDVPRLTRAGLFRWAAEEASLLARLRTVAALATTEIAVYGNDVWRDCLPKGAVHKGLLDYAKDAPALYASAKVNLNVTHPQLVSTVNQRVFDVAAAGGFSLNDEREDLKRFFGDAAVSYRGEKDAADKALYFSKHDNERRERADAMRKVTVAEHTWAHRTEALLSFLREQKIL
jgi:spore maturation protein CgeB